MNAAEAEAWFSANGWRLRSYAEAGKVWVDLLKADSDFTVSRYGVGQTSDEAIVRAKRRWDVEQDSPPPLPRRLP